MKHVVTFFFLCLLSVYAASVYYLITQVIRSAHMKAPSIFCKPESLNREVGGESKLPFIFIS
jgi:hypothetical protein